LPISKTSTTRPSRFLPTVTVSGAPVASSRAPRASPPMPPKARQRAVLVSTWAETSRRNPSSDTRSSRNAGSGPSKRTSTTEPRIAVTIPVAASPTPSLAAVLRDGRWMLTGLSSPGQRIAHATLLDRTSDGCGLHCACTEWFHRPVGPFGFAAFRSRLQQVERADRPGQLAAFDQMHELTVDLRERSYPIQVGTGLLDDNPSLLALARGRSVAVVSDATVDGLLGDRLESLLRPAAHQLLRITLEPGEGTKSWRSLDRIF